MIRSVFCIVLTFGVLSLFAAATPSFGSRQAEVSAEVPDWADEFSREGRPDAAKWTYERGFVRNEEWQYYTDENAYCSNGWLVIEARQVDLPNPGYVVGSKDWRFRSPRLTLTSAALETRGRRSFGYGRIDVRAKIDAKGTLWPAIWLLGDRHTGEPGGERWPECGEIDVLEYYNDAIYANFCWLDDFNGWNKGKPRRQSKWNTTIRPLSGYLARDPAWAEKWHVWSIERTHEAVSLYLDGELMNVQVQTAATNPEGCRARHPFREPMYLILNLAVRAHEHDSPVAPTYPARFLVDYVRYYEFHNSAAR